MKTHLVSILILSATLLSCTESLFNSNENEYIIVDKYQERVELLNGVYNKLTKVHNNQYFSVLSRADDINIYYDTWYNSPPYLRKCGQGFSSGLESFMASEATDKIYANLYSAIANINHLIQSLSLPNDRIVLGEVYFLRAYCYFKLARLFGTPPLVTDIDVNFIIEKPTYKEVYELIETDMLKALELLPDTYTDARIPGETPHKGMAKAVLAEIYLAMAGYPVNDVSKYAEAASMAGQVIENADYYNYGLLDDVANLWKVAYHHNKENIFGLYFYNSGSGGNNTIQDYYMDKGNPYRCYLLGYNPGMKFFMDYPNQYRKHVSFVTGSYIKVEPNPNFTDEPVILYKIFDPLSDPCGFIENVVSRKWRETKRINTSGDCWSVVSKSVTLYIFRYAHTLLTYAEAKTRAGQMDETCYEAVNMIRRRANNVSINTPSEFDLTWDLTPGQFLDTLIWERAWELCLEPEGRWFDIIRLDLRDKLPEFYLSRYDDKYKYLSSSNFGDDWYSFKIPLEDRWLNPNLD